MPQPVQVQLSFVNDSGHPVTLQVLGRTDQGFSHPAAKATPEPALMVRVISDQCAYTYGVPIRDLPSKDSPTGYTTLQVEADFALYASRSLSARPLNELVPLQPKDFPLQPLVTDCSEEQVPDRGAVLEGTHINIQLRASNELPGRELLSASS